MWWIVGTAVVTIVVCLSMIVGYGLWIATHRLDEEDELEGTESACPHGVCEHSLDQHRFENRSTDTEGPWIVCDRCECAEPG